MITSARGLSLPLSIRSMMPITGVEARTVSVLVVLFGENCGCTGIPGMRMIAVSSWFISVASACDRKKVRTT